MMRERRGRILTAFTAAFLVGIGSIVMAANKFEKEFEKEKGAVRLARETKQGGYNLVTTEELKRWMDTGRNILIVDTLPYEKSYKRAHIPGARNFLFPVPAMEEWNEKETGGKTRQDYLALLGPDRQRAIVVYCGFVKCTRSHNGASWAVKLGYKNVYRYPGGIYAWKGAGYPTERGP